MRPDHTFHACGIAGAVALLLLVLPAPPAGAQSGGFPEGVNSCVELKQHLCGEHKLGARYKRCLRQHRSDMPAMCWSKAARPGGDEDVAAAGPDFGAIWANCGDSIDEYCAGKEPDALVSCLASQRSNLAAECSAVVPDAPAPVEAAPTSDEPAEEAPEAAPAEPEPTEPEPAPEG